MKPAHPPTDENIAILDAYTTTDDPIMINASAGTGKTTMLERIELAKPPRSMLYLVFNKRNKEEAEEKMLSTTDVKNFNGLGHGIWSSATNLKLSLDTNKSKNILRTIINEAPKHRRSAMWERYFEVIAAVGMAKNMGYVPSGFDNDHQLCDLNGLIDRLESIPDELTLSLVNQVLTASIKAAYAGSIDFNDQIYMPTLFGGAFPYYPDVMVDEYQDLNPVNHVMVDRLLRNGSRLVGVGDDAQSIYVFRGAVPGSMAKAKARYNMKEFNLSISFRCPEAVVKAAQWRVPHFKWSKPGGHVERLDRMDPTHFVDDAAIICRNNAPLFKLGMQLLGNGRAISIAGSDIGPKLIGVMRKLGHSETNRATLLATIEDWRSEQLAKESTTASDLADCMKVFATYGANLGQAIAYAEHLFKQNGRLRLLTGHKSKGLEYDNVYLLDPFLIRKDDQDQNLRYVMQTRSAGSLYEVDSLSIEW